MEQKKCGTKEPGSAFRKKNIFFLSSNRKAKNIIDASGHPQCSQLSLRVCICVKAIQEHKKPQFPSSW